MGFFDALSKMVQGKPVFEDNGSEGNDDEWGDSKKSDTPQQPQPTNRTPVDDRGYKIIPIVALTHCHSSIHGDSMHTTVEASNMSEHEIELDKIIIDGTRREIDRRLAPKQSHEIVVYEGKLGDSEHKKAQLIYKLVSSGDYFRADFMVEYNREDDRRYSIEEFHPEHSIRDI